VTRRSPRGDARLQLAITVRSRAHSRSAPMLSARVTDSGFVVSVEDLAEVEGVED